MSLKNAALYTTKAGKHKAPDTRQRGATSGSAGSAILFFNTPVHYNTQPLEHE